jgi:hypothetical protein
MAFNKAKWAVGGSHGNPNIPMMHQYSTTDTAATVDSSGYFNDVSTEVRVGDIIQAYVDTGGTPQVGFFQVSSNSSGVVDVNNMALVDLAVQDKVYLFAQIEDVSTPQSDWVVSPVAGKITKWWTVIDAAITGADAALTLEIGGTLVTGSGITIANSGSAAGDVDTATPSAANTVTAGGAIEIITDGASSTASKATVVLEITPTLPDTD